MSFKNPETASMLKLQLSGLEFMISCLKLSPLLSLIKYSFQKLSIDNIVGNSLYFYIVADRQRLSDR